MLCNCISVFAGCNARFQLNLSGSRSIVITVKTATKTDLTIALCASKADHHSFD